MADEQGKQPDELKPKTVCVTCFGARKVITYPVVMGRSREVWMTCPRCAGPSQPVTGP